MHAHYTLVYRRIDLAAYKNSLSLGNLSREEGTPATRLLTRRVTAIIPIPLFE